MQINHPLRLNDWNIRQFLGTILTLQAAVLLLAWYDPAGTRLPLIGQLITLVYLVFVPGVLVLRALKLHGTGAVNTLLYSVGLSLATMMLVGVALDTFLPMAGYARPIALLPLTAAMAVFVLAMCVVCYVRDRDYKGNATVEAGELIKPQALLLLLVPFLAVFGTYLMNHNADNVLLLLLIAAVATIALLVGFTNIIPKELFALAIFVIALALLFHNSLISDSLIGWDVHQENYRAESVVSNGVWNTSVDSIINSMLSIMMLAPIFSIFLHTDVVWVFKIVFPLLFALVPVALYQAYRTQSDEKLAFMAAFFFVSLVVFFSEMLQLARQEIAELFLALIVMLLVDRSMQKARWAFMFVVFAAGLVLSHYGLTIIFIGTVALGWAFVYIASRLGRNAFRDMNRRLGPMLILALVAFCAIWYIYTSSANPFVTIVDVSYKVEQPLEKMATEYLTPETPVVTPSPGTAVVTPAPGQATPTPTPKPITTQPIQLITSGGESSPLHRMFVYLLILTQGILVIGMLTALFARWPMNIRREFYGLALANLLMLGAALVLPNFASSLNTTRVYQIALIFLAPFFVLGWVNVFKALGKATRRSMAGTLSVAVALLSVFLVFYLIFNTGMIFEVAKDVPMSYSLDRQGANVSYTIYNTFERAGALWTIDVQQAIAASQNQSYTPPLFSDTYRWLFLQDWNTSRSYQIPGVAADTPKGAYVYLGTYNVLNHRAIEVTSTGQSQDVALVDLSALESTRNRIYANGGSEVYY